jgi:hypothetical protein
MPDDALFEGLPTDWFPLKPSQRSVLDGIDPVTPTSKATSKAVQTFLARHWIVRAGIDPSKGAMYTRTLMGQRVLDVDRKVRDAGAKRLTPRERAKKALDEASKKAR